MLYTGWNTSISGLWAAILEFLLPLHHTVCEIASLNLRGVWGKFNELAPVLRKGASLWNWMEKYTPGFRECWNMVSRRGLWMRRTWIGWGWLKGWWYEECACGVSLNYRKRSDELYWIVWALNVSRPRSREHGWDGLGMLSGRKRMIGWTNAQEWMWLVWWAGVLWGKHGGEVLRGTWRLWI